MMHRARTAMRRTAAAAAARPAVARGCLVRGPSAAVARRAVAPVQQARAFSAAAAAAAAASTSGGGQQGGSGRSREDRRKMFWGATLVSLCTAGGLFYVALSTYDASVAVLGANQEEEAQLGEQLGFAVEPVMLGLQTVQWISGHRNVDDIEGVTAKVAQIVADRYSSIFVPQLNLAARLRAVEGQAADADLALEEARELAAEFGEHQGRLSYLLPSEEEWKHPERPRWELRPADAAADAGVWVLRAYVPPRATAEGTVAGDNGPFGRAEATTVVRQADGTLALFNPVPCGDEALEALRGLGKVTRVVAQRRSEPFLRQVAEQFPEAGVHAVRFDDDGSAMVASLDRESGCLQPAEAVPLGDAFEQLPVRGGDFAEMAFLHRPSRTLVVAEACQVAEPDLPDFAGRMRMFASGGLAFRNRGVFVPNQFVSMVTNLQALQESARGLVESQPARLVTATGAVVEQPAAELARAFGFVQRLGPVAGVYYATRYRRRAGMN